MSRVPLSRLEVEAGELPQLCLCCGAPAVGHDSKKFAWHPQWLYLLLFCGILPLLVVSFIVTKHMTVRAPFCAEHHNHWTRRKRIALGTLGA